MTDSYVLVKKALQALHSHSSGNRYELLSSLECFCFYCKTKFVHTDITEWIDDASTALCPNCGIDAVLGSACGYDLTPALIDAMHDFWFEADLFPGFDYDFFQPGD